MGRPRARGRSISRRYASLHTPAFWSDGSSRTCYAGPLRSCLRTSAHAPCQFRYSATGAIACGAGRASLPPVTQSMILQCKRHLHDALALRLNAKAEVARQLQHPQVIRQSLARYTLGPAPAAIAYELGEQQCPEALAFEVRAHQDGKFRLD